MEDLPVEIIQKIFLGLCPPRTTFPLHRDEPRLLIARVCSRWRTIALSTPTLWATFYIHRAFWHDSVPYTSILCTWISRAAQSTLSFEFCTPYPHPHVQSSPMIEKFVFPVIHRCSLLSLHLDIATMHRLLMLPPRSLHALESLSISIQDESPTRVVDPTPLATAFESCPHLRTFSLAIDWDYQWDYFGIANFNLPWHQLTTLWLHVPLTPADECLDIIRRCTSLQQCTIKYLPYASDLARDRIIERFSHPPITLRFLDTLCVELVDWEPEDNDNYHTFFQALRLPRLRKFQPTGFPPTFWLLSTFQPILGDTIQELDLSSFEFPESLPETLALVPNLEILWLGCDSFEHPSRMTCALGNGTVAPRLKTLYMHDVRSLKFLLDILEARAVAARTNCDIPPLDVMVFCRGGPSDEARMMALAEVGIRIHLNVTNPRLGI